jgi:transcriptional regulator with XRE-family HTH domain
MHRSPRTRAQVQVDVHVGSRIRLRREGLKLSQGQLGEMVGVSFQQVQKYEKGSNRIAASTLLSVSQALDVSPSFFFEDMPKDSAPSAGELSPNAATREETARLVRAYYRIPWRIRHRLSQLMKSIGDTATARRSAAKSSGLNARVLR